MHHATETGSSTGRVGHLGSKCDFTLFLTFCLFQELNGPKDTHEAKYSVVVRLLESVTARFVRFIPTSASSLRVMRAELYGCMAEPLPPYGGKVFFKELVPF